MSALAEALVAAQRTMLSAYAKRFVAAETPTDLEGEEEDFRSDLDAVGLTDKLEQGYLLECLRGLRHMGAAAPAAPKANGEPEKATDKQRALIVDLCTEADGETEVAASVLPRSRLSASRILSKIADIDEWLDSGVSDRYQREPLAQHWARVAKVNEEAGEAIEALIAWTGQNPRKPQRDDARDELLEELADVALTAILGMQHFVKDADTTMWLVWKRLFRLHDRMREKVEADAA